MTEQEIRRRTVELIEEMDNLSREASRLFRTNDWVRTDEELPPVNLEVLGCDGNLSATTWATYLGEGRWHHTYSNGNAVSNSLPPKFWFAVPPLPKKDE